MRASIAHISTVSADFEAEFARRLQWSADTDSAIESAVAEVLSQVRARGDAALLEYTRRWDGLAAPDMAALTLGPDRFAAAHAALPAEQRDALEQAARRIRAYHQAQKKQGGETWTYRDDDGTLLGQKVTPLDRVGIYVPGGRAAYPSSLLMNAIPAQVAGVGEIVMVVPHPGAANPLLMAAAHVAGVTRGYSIGGAQAIAALAFGTATVPRVDKITGPGNAYVAAAKRRVFGVVGIDMIAGPSEILVLADGTAPPDWVAMDLFSQAEHDELAQSVLLSPDAEHIAAVQREMDRLLPGLPRADIVARSLAGRGMLVHTRSMEEACAISNRIAPEHLEIACADPWKWEPLLRHAGAIFLGRFTSESLGDYCAGPNHVLPTSGTARFSGPLSVYDFQKRSSLIEVSSLGAQRLGPIAAVLADGEGLAAHAHAARMRLSNGSGRMNAPPTPPDNPALAVLRSDVLSMQAYAVQDARGLIKLDAMENPYPLPAALQAALGARLATVPLHRYPGDRVIALHQALARHVGVPEGFGLMLGNGSDELISLVTMACDLPGATVLAPVPGFVMYAMSAQLQGLRFVGVDLTADFQLDAQAMLAAIDRERPALVWLAYPNNPTANLWDDAVIERIIRAAPGLVVIDEAYQPFASRSWLPRMAAHRHVLLMRTLSKFGLAGVRIGYLVGPQELVAQIDKLRPPYNVSSLNAEAALFALEHADTFAQQAAAIRSERQRLAQALAQLPGVTVWPSEANMILVRVPGAQQAFEALRAGGVLVKNVSRMHPLLADCLRLTVGSPDENTRLLAALRAAL